MEIIKITTEQLTKLRQLYPHIASAGNDVLVTYSLARHTYQVERELNQPQLPKFINNG